MKFDIDHELINREADGFIELLRYEGNKNTYTNADIAIATLEWARDIFYIHSWCNSRDIIGEILKRLREGRG